MSRIRIHPTPGAARSRGPVPFVVDEVHRLKAPPQGGPATRFDRHGVLASCRLAVEPSPVLRARMIAPELGAGPMRTPRPVRLTAYQRAAVRRVLLNAAHITHPPGAGKAGWR
ncbi:MAG: hypothetical protein AB1941_27505 [Gemmatimonadota bacterium]